MPTEPAPIPGRAVLELRTALGWSQCTLAQALGISRSTLASWETRGIDTVRGYALAGLMLRAGRYVEAGALTRHLPGIPS